MKSSTKFVGIFILAMLFVVVMAVIAFLVTSQAEKSRSEIPVYGQVPDFEFTRSDGTPFGSENLLGKITVLDFFFTNCPGPCPIMSSNISELYKLFKGSDKIQFVSISVDPVNDSLAALQQYAGNFGVNDNRWVFLHGNIDDVRNLSEKGFFLAADNLPTTHSTKFVLIDEKGQIRNYYSGTDDASIKVLISDIRQLVKNLDAKS